MKSIADITVLYFILMLWIKLIEKILLYFKTLLLVTGIYEDFVSQIFLKFNYLGNLFI